MNRRVVSLIATVGLAAGLVTASAGGAAAYPPGTGLVLTASPRIVLVNHPVAAKASHAQPGCLVTFWLGARHLAARASSTGLAAVTLLAPPKPGAYTMSATVSGTGCTTERAYTRVVTTGPLVSAPPSFPHGRVFKVVASRFPAHSVVTIRLTSTRAIIVQHRYTNSVGTVVMYFKVARRGTYVITASTGHTYATRVLHIT